jgi:hypothetical protein
MSGTNGIVVAGVGYLGASVVAALYYTGKADANSSGTVTEAEFDAAVEAGNPIISTVLGPGMTVAKEVLAMIDIIAEAEPA